MTNALRQLTIAQTYEPMRDCERVDYHGEIRPYVVDYWGREFFADHFGVTDDEGNDPTAEGPAMYANVFVRSERFDEQDDPVTRIEVFDADGFVLDYIRKDSDNAILHVIGGRKAVACVTVDQRKTILDARMAAHGFTLEQTGGGCTCYLRTDGTVEESITLDDESRAPYRLSDRCTLWARPTADDDYNAEGSWTLAQLLAALDDERDEYYLLHLRLAAGYGR